MTTTSAAFAADTKVPVERTRAELDALLAKHGAANRGVITDDENGTAAVAFILQGLKYRLDVPLPRMEDLRLKPGEKPPYGWRGWSTSQRDAWMRKEWEQLCRARWRAVLLLVKSKLEMVRLGVSTIEREFLADLVLPGGKTVHHAMAANIQRALAEGKMPTLMLPEAT
jgi:hypothetical protein